MRGIANDRAKDQSMKIERDVLSGNGVKTMKFDCINIYTEKGIVEWPGYLIKETPGLTVSFEELRDGKSFAPTAKACGCRIGPCFTSKAPAIEWCKWVWARLPSDIKTLLERCDNPDYVHQLIIADRITFEVVRFAKTHLCLAARYIKQAEMNLVGRVVGDFLELVDDEAEVAARCIGLTFATFDEKGETRKLVGFPLVYFEKHKAELAKFGWTLKLESELI